MTLVATAAPLATAARATSPRLRVSGWDVLALAVIATLWFAVAAFRCQALPMQLWDESRNANNALEMALGGSWLTPTYAGVVDHWNTKPPLMIWAMAALLKLGLPPLLALRLPAMGAALAAAAMVWSALRGGCGDRLGGFAAAVLLIGAPLFTGVHGARTADYDAPESAFILAYVLAAWAALESGRTRWLALAALAAVGGVLTKGVAALLPLPGLVLFALLRPRRLAVLLGRPGTWAAAALFALGVGGYYLARQIADPGYLAAVAHNELGGRFLQVTENHRGGWGYYLHVLALGGGLGAPMAALSLVTLVGPDPRRRDLVAAAMLSAAFLLLVLSAARSKMEWYAVPLLPLLCLMAGAGVTDALRWAAGATEMRSRPPPAAAGILVRAALAGALAAAALSGLVTAHALLARGRAQERAGPYGYGGFLQAVRAQGGVQRLTVVDGGFSNDAGFRAYHPMLRFYAELSTLDGLPVAVKADDSGLQPGAVVASCDPRAISALQRDLRLLPLLQRQGCLLARAPGGPPEPASRR